MERHFIVLNNVPSSW